MLKVVDPAAASIGLTQAANASEPIEPELAEQGRLEFIEQALAYQDGALAGADLRAFEASLRVSGQKRKLFVDLQIFSQRLREVLQRQSARQLPGEPHRPESDPLLWLFLPEPESPAPDTATPVPAKTKRPFIAPGVAVLLAMAALFSVLCFKSVPEPSTAIAPIAYLTQTANAKWISTPAREPSILTPGQFKLNSGSTCIEFFSGARLIVEGPAEFQLISTQRVFCRSGRFRATIPLHARGFRFETPRLNVIAGSAAFGVFIENGITELHALQGAIEWQQRPGVQQLLLEGEAVEVDPATGMRRFPAHPAGFLSEASLAERTAQAASERLNAWRAAGVRLEADPALLAKFDFENQLAKNSAPNPPAAGATLVGGEWSRGRFPEKTALEFNRPGDRVRFDLGASPKSFTLITWVKIDTLLPANRTLFSSGAATWQITPTGHVRFELSGSTGSLAGFQTRAVFTPDRLGQWTLLALVFNSDTKELVHYLDGLPSARQPFAPRAPLRLNDATVGNQNGSLFDHSPSPLMGRMDEFALFARPLASSEINAIWEASRP